MYVIFTIKNKIKFRILKSIVSFKTATNRWANRKFKKE